MDSTVETEERQLRSVIGAFRAGPTAELEPPAPPEALDGGAAATEEAEATPGGVPSANDAAIGEQATPPLGMGLGSDERPGTAPAPSETNGLGEDTMGVFIRGYLESILQPFAENVNELHKVVTRISVDIGDMANRERQHQQETEELRQQAQGLRAEQDAANDDLQEIKEFLRSQREEVAGANKAGNNLRARLDELDVRAKEQNASIEDVQASLKKAQSRMGKLNEAQLASERVWAQEIWPTVEKLKMAVGEIEEKQSGMTKLLDEKGLAKIPTTLEAWHEAHEQMGATLKELTSKLEHDNVDLESRLHSISTSIENHARDLQAARNVGDHHGSILEEHKRKLNVSATMEEALKERISNVVVRLTGHDVHAKEFQENISELQNFMHKATSGRDHTEWLTTLEAAVEKHSKDIEATSATTSEHSEELTRQQARFEINEDTTTYLGARVKRVEHKIGVEAPHRLDRNTSRVSHRDTVSDKVFANLKKAWAVFDTDGDGTMTVDELGTAMANMGYHADVDMLRDMIDEVDEDGSGCIEFDEFCGMMSKLVDANGEIDAHAAAKKAIDSMNLLARQKQAIETIEEHSVIIKEYSQTLGILADAKGDHSTRIDHLETHRSEMGGEVRKLRQGLDLSQEYWKGLSKGLKDTKRKVHTEGEFIPSARSLATNCTLPPLTSTPRTAR